MVGGGIEFHLPRPDGRLRAVIIGCGFLVFIWLSPEDNHTIPVIGVGLVLTLVLTLRWVLRNLGGKSFPIRYLPLVGLIIGAVVGLGTSVTTAGLMFFKNALHAHIFLDFPPNMMLAILGRAPFWATAGALGGLGIGILCLAWSKR